MHTFGVWILLCGLLPAARCVFTGGFCNVSLNLLRVGSCRSLSGPNIHCSRAVLRHLHLIKEAQVSYLSQARGIGPTRYDDYKMLKEELRALIRLIQNFHRFLKRIYTPNQTTRGATCVSLIDLEAYISQLKSRDNAVGFEYWIDVYYPAFAGVELTFGLLGNMMVVVIFAKHDDIRTPPNKVILNLAIGDILLLITNIVVFYSRYRWLPNALTSTTCYIMSYSRTAGIASSVYSMVVLSMLRFLATASTPGSKASHIMNKYFKIVILLPLVWILAGLIGIFDTYNANPNCEFPKGTLRQYFRFACICLLPLVAIGAFSIATLIVIRNSVKQLPGEQTSGTLHEIRARQRGSRVILCLVIVFCITYLPLNVYLLIGKDNGPNDHIYVFTTQLLIPLSSCLNPVALCVGSSKYRKHFKNYLLQCCCCKCCPCYSST